MKTENYRFLSSDGKTRINSVIWHPEQKPVATIQIIHGMTEYIERYKEFAQFFSDQGFLIYGQDLTGHGKSNYPDCAEESIYVESWNDYVEDTEYLYQNMRNRYPDVPHYIMGFSLGSFVLRAHQLRYPKSGDALILIGTGNPDVISLRFAQLILHLGCRDKAEASKLVKKLAFDSYNSQVNLTKEEKQSHCAWLLKNKKDRYTYENDPFIHDEMTPQFFNEFLNGMIKIESNEKKFRLDKEVIFLTGSDDPVADLRHHKLEIVEERYKKAGAKVLSQVIPGSRHDILHDECKRIVYGYIQNYLLQSANG